MDEKALRTLPAPFGRSGRASCEAAPCAPQPPSRGSLFPKPSGRSTPRAGSPVLFARSISVTAGAENTLPLSQYPTCPRFAVAALCDAPAGLSRPCGKASYVLVPDRAPSAPGRSKPASPSRSSEFEGTLANPALAGRMSRRCNSSASGRPSATAHKARIGVSGRDPHKILWPQQPRIPGPAYRPAEPATQSPASSSLDRSRWSFARAKGRGVLPRHRRVTRSRGTIFAFSRCPMCASAHSQQSHARPHAREIALIGTQVPASAASSLAAR